MCLKVFHEADGRSQSQSTNKNRISHILFKLNHLNTYGVKYPKLNHLNTYGVKYPKVQVTTTNVIVAKWYPLQMLNSDFASNLNLMRDTSNYIVI